METKRPRYRLLQIPFDFGYLSKSPDLLGRVMWLSDSHRGRNTNFVYIPEMINRINPDAYVDTGDFMIDNNPSEMTTYLADVAAITAPKFYLPGNHDRGPAMNYAWYDQYFGMDYFSFVVGGVRFIGVGSRHNPDGTFSVLPTVKAQVISDFAALTNEPVIIMCHTPSVDSDLTSLFASYGIKAYLHGHAHANCTVNYDDGYMTVSGGSNMQSTDGVQSNTDGGMMILDVYSSRIEITYLRARWPWDTFKSTNSGIANDVKYIPITIPL